MKVNIFHIINSNLAINVNDGELVYAEISKALSSELTISFIDIDRVSTAFLNETVGKYAILYPDNIKSISFEIPENKSIFKDKIDDVIENALMADEYDELVDNATLN